MREVDSIEMPSVGSIEMPEIPTLEPVEPVTPIVSEMAEAELKEQSKIREAINKRWEKLAK